MTHDRRLAELEKRSDKSTPTVLYSSYIRPDGSTVPTKGFEMPDGSKLMKRDSESIEAFQDRACVEARLIGSPYLIVIEAIT